MEYRYLVCANGHVMEYVDDLNNPYSLGELFEFYGDHLVTRILASGFKTREAATEFFNQGGCK